MKRFKITVLLSLTLVPAYSYAQKVPSLMQLAGTIPVKEAFTRWISLGNRAAQEYFMSLNIPDEIKEVLSDKLYQHVQLFVSRVVQVVLESQGELSYEQILKKVEKLAQTQQPNISIDAQDENGFTALMYAAFHNNTSIVKMLIAAGVDLNKQNAWKQTALMYTTFNQSKEAACLLINAGADLNVRDGCGQTALMYTVYRDRDIAKMLIAAGADVNARKNNGETALLCAICSNNKELVELLINAGADLYPKNDVGCSIDSVIHDKSFKELGNILEQARAKQQQCLYYQNCLIKKYELVSSAKNAEL